MMLFQVLHNVRSRSVSIIITHMMPSNTSCDLASAKWHLLKHAEEHDHVRAGEISFYETGHVSHAQDTTAAESSNSTEKNVRIFNILLQTLQLRKLLKKNDIQKSKMSKKNKNINK